MHLNRLSCLNFKNLKEIEIFPDREMNVICGENAQGKTNIIEAIWLFSGAKSFKGTKDTSFINFDAKKAKNEINFTAFGVEYDAKIEFSDKKAAFLNGKQLKATSNLAGKFCAVIFAPDDLGLVKDGPQIRRRFLDTAIGQIYPNYIEILKENELILIREGAIPFCDIENAFYR